MRVQVDFILFVILVVAFNMSYISFVCWFLQCLYSLSKRRFIFDYLNKLNTLLCSNSGSSTVIWKKHNRIISAGENIIRKDPRLQLDGGHNLRISQLKDSDAGEYVCQIETYGSPLDQRSTLEILGQYLKLCTQNFFDMNSRASILNVLESSRDHFHGNLEIRKWEQLNRIMQLEQFGSTVVYHRIFLAIKLWSSLF